MAAAEVDTAARSDRQIGASIEQVSKVYETRGEPITALRNCSLELAPGEFVSVVGPSRLRQEHAAC